MSLRYDWRTLAAATVDPATRHRPTELSDVQREILRLHRQEGLQVRDLATLFGMSDHDVYVLIHGAHPGTA
jgi:DNA-directed RNA polymerase specialized sigma24 family protein